MNSDVELALAVLVDENPLPTVGRGELTNDALARLPYTLEYVQSSGFASEVADQPRRSRGRLLVVSAAVLGAAVAVALVGPALGLDLPGIDFFHSAKAPASAIENFDQLAVGAPPGMDPQVLAGEAHQVPLAGSAETISVAPTKQGGYCAANGCDRLGTVPLNITWSGGASSPIPTNGLPDPGNNTLVASISGAVNSDYASSVEIHFQDGTTASPQITWVSEPIHQGFFVYHFSPQEQQPGHGVESVVAYDSKGDIVTTAWAGINETAPPSDAILEQKHAAASIQTPTGAAVVWEAPTRYQGECAWLEFEGHNYPFAPCQPKGYDWNDGLATGFRPTRDAVLFVGTAGQRYSSIRLTYADGDSSTVTPAGRFLLFAIPANHLQPGHQPASVEALDSSGQPIPGAAYSIPPQSGDPCRGVLPVNDGQRCP